MSEEEPRYSDEEFALILKKTGELADARRVAELAAAPYPSC